MWIGILILKCDSVTHVVTRFTGITSVQYKGGGPWSSSCARWPSLDAMHCPLFLCFSLFLSVSLSNTNMPMQKKKKSCSAQEISVVFLNVSLNLCFDALHADRASVFKVVLSFKFKTGRSWSKAALNSCNSDDCGCDNQFRGKK